MIFKYAFSWLFCVWYLGPIVFLRNARSLLFDESNLSECLELVEYGLESRMDYLNYDLSLLLFRELVLLFDVINCGVYDVDVNDDGW